MTPHLEDLKQQGLLHDGEKIITDVDGNEFEYRGELDEEDFACGQGEMTYVHPKCVVSYVGMFFKDKAEGTGKDDDRC